MRQFYDIEQNTDEWLRLRLGIPTASEFSTATAQAGPRGGEPKGRRTYLLKLLGERLTGEYVATWEGNAHTERGKALEAEARDLYALVTGNQVSQGGFWKADDLVKHGAIGASPDSLVNADGLLEIKTKLPHLHLDCLLRDQIPSEHLDQLQGALLVTGRAWIDFMSYWPGLPPFIKRVYPDPVRLNELVIHLGEFNRELAELEERFNG